MNSRLFFVASMALFSLWSSRAQCGAQNANEKSERAAQNASDWIEGSGENLRMRIRGKILGPNGEPTSGLEIRTIMSSEFDDQLLDTRLSGNEFEFWVPVNARPWYRLTIDAISASKDQQAKKLLLREDLRDAAVNGITLTLSDATRRVEVLVVDGGKPVPNAHVQATFAGPERIAVSDASGIARFNLLPDQTIGGLTAWTDDFRIGGYSFPSTPKRDESANQHIVELSRCRDQKIRFIDEHNEPVSNVRFSIHVATPRPNVNYVGINEHSFMTTDERGEAIYEWFPDWDAHHFYVTADTDDWVSAANAELIDGLIVAKLKKSQIGNRKTVAGQLKSFDQDVAGVFVSFYSFQGEEEHRSDVLHAFADPLGKFAVDVLPDATYCVCANDRQLVSDIIDLIPYESKSDKTTIPTLAVTKGQRVDVILTSGPNKTPIARETVRLETPHEFAFQRDGRESFGHGGRRWHVTTDDQGRAMTWALPGKLSASIYSANWKPEMTIDVEADKIATLEFHENVDIERTVTGRLILPAGVSADLSGAEIFVGASDPEITEQSTASTNKDGTFEFRTRARQVGIFAYTKDGKAAGETSANSVDAPIDLQLLPSHEFRGRLLGADEQPLAGLAIQAAFTVPDAESSPEKIVRTFVSKTIECKTDADGNYTIVGVPSNIATTIRSQSALGSQFDRLIDRVFLVPGESRPRLVSRPAKEPVPNTNRLWSDRFETGRRDCELNGFYLMVILSSSEEAALFVNDNLKDYEKKPAVSKFIQLLIQPTGKTLNPEDVEFAQSMSFQIPNETQVFAYAFDSEGKELGRIEISLNDKLSIEKAAQFVAEYSPPQLDAQNKWDEAFAEAKISNRKVWARIGQRYCGPCFLLARWLDDHGELLAKDYVMLKVDDVRDLHGNEVAERITRGGFFGIPFFAIYDQDQKLVIDAKSPIGNIGYPSGSEGKKHMRKMLMETRTRLTDEEIESIVGSLED